MTAVTLRKIPTSQLVANRRNVREHLDDIDQLAASIRANGVLQPLIVNDQAGTLIVTDGHRRLEAARRAQVPALMCIVTTDAADRSVITTMLAASMHKELKPIEQGRAFKQLRDAGVGIVDIARSTGYSANLISNRLLLLELPVEAQEMVEDEQLTIGQATELARQVKAKRSGSTGVAVKKSAHFRASHSLSRKVICFHHDTRILIGGIGCGQCWEKAIREDERERIAREARPVVALDEEPATTAPRTWQVVRMDGYRISHPYLVRDPKCPEKRHPTRDCGCDVFRTIAEAEAYIARQAAAS